MFKFLKNIIKRVKEPLFILFVGIAIVVWYLNRLNGTYQQDLLLPIYIEGIENPTQSAGNNHFNLYCRVRGKGYDFLLYKLYPLSKKVTIPISDIISSSSTKNNPTINMSLLETSVSDKLKGMELVKLHDTNLKIANIAYAQKFVKIASDIKIKIKGGYMQIGETRFDPCSVLVRGDKRLIDNIDSVLTSKKVISTPFNSLSDDIAIVKRRGVSYSPDRVEYNIMIDRFTERKIYAVPKITTSNIPSQNIQYEVIPEQVELCFNVAQSINNTFSADSFEVYVDYDDKVASKDKIGDNLYKVKIRNLPIEATIQYIEPAYITILKQN
ncbi:MAG: hypothetical protein RR388_06480 [Rikenellaceae bacterium]